MTPITPTRVRFAPSPTGNLHIGTLRTALFAWLFARSTNGTFITRIEDTDLARSHTDFETSIFDGLSWMGIDSDEDPIKGGPYGPYRQSERIEKGVYLTCAMDLIARKKAYYCFDTQAELDAERDAAVAAKRPYVYSRKALSLSDDVVKQYLNAGRPYTIRFKMPDSGTLCYTDLIRGEMRFDLALVGDFVIMKSDGTPAYNFAVAVDDRDMQVTHVIRGEDHISNMPRQLCIYDALGASWPQFAHMPMILGPDKAKLSKRHGATNVIEYKTKGILSDALFNYLSLLGWSPEGEDEILTRSEITAQFSLNRVSRSNAIFDSQKLTWMNGQYIRQLSPDALQHHLRPYLTPETQQGLSDYPEDVQQHALRSIQDNLSDLTQVNTYLEVYVMPASQYTAQVNALTFKPEALSCLRQLIAVFEGLSSWTAATLNDAVEGVMKAQNLGKGKVLRPLRLAVTSVMTGPYVIDIIDVFGRDKTLQRLNHVVTFH